MWGIVEVKQMNGRMAENGPMTFRLFFDGIQHYPSSQKSYSKQKEGIKLFKFAQMELNFITMERLKFDALHWKESHTALQLHNFKEKMRVSSELKR